MKDTLLYGEYRRTIWFILQRLWFLVAGVRMLIWMYRDEGSFRVYAAAGSKIILQFLIGSVALFAVGFCVRVTHRMKRSEPDV